MGSCSCCNDDEKCEINNKTNYKLKLSLNILGVILFILGMMFWSTNNKIAIFIYIFGYLLIGYDIILNAVKKIFSKDMFDENFLMTAATIGAFCIGAYTEAIAVMLFYKVGEYLQDLAVENSKNKIRKVIKIKSEYANLKKENEIIVVDPNDVKIDDIIIVKTGERIPLDGMVILGVSNLDMSMLNGESVPRKIDVNDNVLAGSINVGPILTIKVTKLFENSTVSKIINLIENAVNKKSKSERFITRFAKVYTPIITVSAVLVALLLPFVLNIGYLESIRRALIFLVVSCPCALVISVPLGFFVGIGTSSKHGILIKGSNYLDILNNVNTIVFDKTGTLTDGTFSIKDIMLENQDITKHQLLEYIVLAEIFSNHYISKSIIKSYTDKIDKERVKYHKEIAGFGIEAIIDDKNVIVGNYKLMQKYEIECDEINKSGTIIYLAIDGIYMGNVLLADSIKKTTDKLVEGLKRVGVDNIVMLTGDNKDIAEDIARELGISKVYSELLPEDKAKILEDIKDNMIKDKKVAYVGDGINDGPVIATADVGIAMGKGSDIAIEIADMVIMTDEPIKIIKSIKIAKKTKNIVIQNIIFALLVKACFLVLSVYGFTNMWEAVFSDVGVSLIAILNCLRISNIKD